MTAGRPGTRPGSGDGFVTVADGSRRWGRFGAAGVLVRHVDDGGTHWYLLARRSEHCHLGGTWAVPGGALDEGEAPLVGAVREFVEEIGPLPEYELRTTYVDDHGGWTYTTHVVDVPGRFPLPTELGWETSEVRWVAAHEAEALELLGAFRAALVRLGLLPGGPVGDGGPAVGRSG